MTNFQITIIATLGLMYILFESAPIGIPNLPVNFSFYTQGVNHDYLHVGPILEIEDRSPYCPFEDINPEPVAQSPPSSIQGQRSDQYRGTSLWDV